MLFVNYINEAGNEKQKRKRKGTLLTEYVKESNMKEMETPRSSSRSCRNWMMRDSVRLWSLRDTRLETGPYFYAIPTTPVWLGPQRSCVWGGVGVRAHQGQQLMA